MTLSTDTPSAPVAVVSPSSGTQGELFDLESVEGYAALGRRQRLFAKGVFDGLSQREAARQAGMTGSDEVIDAAASRLIRSPTVRRLLNQAWTRAGADIARTLREAEEIRRRAFRELIDSPNAKRGKDALDQWKIAASLIASIHGRLSVRVEGHVTHGASLDVIIPPNALPGMAAMRREIVATREQDANHAALPIDVGARR